MRLILASRSPRRAELLRQVGLPFEVMAADVDESLRAAEPADHYVVRLAAAKAAAVYHRIGDPGTLVLGADTAVVLAGRILGILLRRGEPEAGVESIALAVPLRRIRDAYANRIVGF